MRRRENNTGTVYKLSGNRSKPWVARVCLGYDTLGNRNWHTVGYFRTKSEAARSLAEYIVAPEQFTVKKELTLAQLHDEWKSIHYPTISKSTRDNYSACYNYLAPLYNKKFTELRTAHFQHIIDSAKKSPSTLRKIKIFVGLLYKYALENDIVTKNYAEFIRLPHAEKSEKETFSDLEIKKFFSVDDDPAAQIILMLIYSGLRIQELLNLTVFDVDLEQRLLRGGLKTDSGKNRIVPLHNKTLKYWKAWVSKASDRIFIKDDGKPLTANYYRTYMLYPLEERLGIPQKTPHKARHTCATILAREGVAPLLIQQILGHSDYAFTANTYTHKDYSSLVEAIEKMT